MYNITPYILLQLVATDNHYLLRGYACCLSTSVASRSCQPVFFANYCYKYWYTNDKYSLCLQGAQSNETASRQEDYSSYCVSYETQSVSYVVFVPEIRLHLKLRCESCLRPGRDRCQQGSFHVRRGSLSD